MQLPIVVGAVLALVISPTLAFAASDQRAFFDLTINLVSKGQVLIILRPNDVLIPVSDLQKSGLTLPPGKEEIIEGETYISLASLAPTITYELDEKALALRITAASGLLGTTIRDVQQKRPTGVIYTQDTSAFLNYSINARDLQENTRSLSAFGEIGLASKNNLLYSSFSGSSEGNFTRGLTNLTLRNPDALNRWVVGDTFTQMGNLGGSSLIGGISFTRDFSLDPYLTTTQPFGLQGAVTTPSTVEVYSNGVLLRREQLPPGQFELRNLPIPAGSSTTRLIIRDAFGREQEITTPFYFSPGILQVGLSDYSFNLGFIRNSLNESFSYDSLAFSSRYRQGLTDSLTAGMRLEATSNLISGGGDMTLRTSLGTFDLAAAASSSEGLNGYAGLLGYSYIATGFSFSGAVRTFSSHYAHSSLDTTTDRPLLETSVQVGLPLGNIGSLTAQYSASKLRDEDEFRNRLSLFSSIRVAPKMNVFISASQANQPSQGLDNSLYVGLSYFFGNNTSGSIGYQNQNDQATITASLENPLSSNNGFGYRLRAQTQNEVNTNDATLLYQTNFGRYELNYYNAGDNNSLSLNAAGGVAWIGGSPFLSRPLENSYVLVRVPGIEGVRVYLNNNEVGRTNSQGNLVVTNLLPYYSNRISITTEDIPLNYTIDKSSQNVAVPTRAGGIVEFGLVKVQNFVGKILIEDATGKSISPSYGELRVKVGDKEMMSPLGNLGEFYLENILPGKYNAEVKYQEGFCRFEIEVPALEEQFINLGTLRCLLQGTKGQN
ncbi:fimbria/pilus outer membrane usher protein [Ancylothrix sp. C2]|uniref:fimbria/pilus outer membrane usher protein n=1 Tax=Ancylothrix sp. D3o TaxID=2953691 RepID=UPI0021BAF080|nr:fimbria/pilus outer membrane usher protein [Ancylothrix sp. D3o]MCT7951350.1 fimbria/pilus outer membrane usher protein [Ancylothrix sp. D3o]